MDLPIHLQSFFVGITEEDNNLSIEPYLHCPFCGFGYVHMEKPMSFPGGEGYEAEHVFNMRVRGDVMLLSFWAECGHKWVLAFGFHKGLTHYKLVLVPAQEPGTGVAGAAPTDVE